MSPSRARTVALTALVVLLALAVGAGAYVLTRLERGGGTSRAAAGPDEPAAYRAATVAPGVVGTPTRGVPGPTAAGVARDVGPALAAGGLGDRVRAQVLDVATGQVLLSRSGATPATPASTSKIVTAAAVLVVHRATDRITTRVVSDGRGTLILIGAGDPTLSAAAAGTQPDYPGAARLSDLAAAVRRADVPVTRVVVDGSLFTGPSVSPAWAPEDVPSSYESAVTALMVDGGRDAPGDTIRSATPDLAAGRAFATLLGRPGLPVTRGVAPASGTTVASVRSAPYVTLVQQMLADSDDVVAEVLARQVAMTRHLPVTFTGGAQGVRSAVRTLGVDPGATLSGGSGLAPSDRIAPATLAQLLRVVATRPNLRPVLAGLPVAGWSGTLTSRYLTGTPRSAAGDVRAKTGTLTGVSALAGLVHDRGGRLLAFAVIADDAGPTADAELALDAVAARLAACGCR